MQNIDEKKLVKYIVAFINSEEDLVFFETIFVDTKYSVYFGKETEGILILERMYRDSQREITRQKEMQKKIIQMLNNLTTNENTKYIGEENK